MQYVDVVSCLWLLLNTKMQLFIYHRRRPTARLLKFPIIVSPVKSVTQNSQYSSLANHKIGIKYASCLWFLFNAKI